MAYDDTSFVGDMIVDEYDDRNNFFKPYSPTGFYFYHILGDGFDLISEMQSKFLNDLDLLSADSSSLDKFWGVSYNMPRPSINGRLLTDEEYRIYLYLRNCRLVTAEDLLINFEKCFHVDNYEVYITNDTSYFYVVDHPNYESATTDTSNIAKTNDDDTRDFIIDHDHATSDVLKIESNLSSKDETIQVINIPNQNWDSAFLDLLVPYISLKGNVQIREYDL